MTKAERQHLDRVASLPCVLCLELGQQQQSPTNIHHVREGQGMSQRASNFLTVALCRDCHQGPKGLHGDKTMLQIAKVDELDLLAKTIELAHCAGSRRG